jgi:aspartate/methionine/tyrosine aminotransferase
MSKDFGANGIRLGAVVSQNNSALITALETLGLYSYVSSATDHIACNILEDEEWTRQYILENRQRLASSHRIVAEWAKDNGIEYAKNVNAGFFLWVNLGAAYQQNTAASGGAQTSCDDSIEAIVARALLEQKVVLAVGKKFMAERAGWFRIVFSYNEEWLREGLRRVIVAIRGKADEA